MNSDDQDEKDWCSVLREQYPEKHEIVDASRFPEIVSSWEKLLDPLGIVEEQDQYRFMQLSVLLTPKQKMSPLMSVTVQRILSYMDWEPKSRLDFIYKHVVGRPVSAVEEDFGPVFRTPRPS